MRRVLLSVFVAAIVTSASTVSAQTGLLRFDTHSSASTALGADEEECGNGTCHFAGHVVLISGKQALSSDRLDIQYVLDDTGHYKVEHATAAGNVLLIDGNNVTACQRMDLNSDLITGALSTAEVHVKRPGTFKGVAGGMIGPLALHTGRDSMVVRGDITRTGENTFHIKDAYFTPCDCAGGKPTFSIRARSADVELGSHAIFYMPVLQPKDQALPFPFALPALYVPVARRKTGFLPPFFAVQDAFYIEEAFFLVLGESYDITATVGDNLARGLRTKLEFRYAPDVDINGVMSLMYAHDTTFKTEWATALTAASGVVSDPSLYGYDPTTPFGDERWAASYVHESDVHGRFPVRANIGLYSDSLFQQDFTYTLAGQTAQYAPSRAVAEYRGDDLRLSVGGAYYQDFTRSTQVFGPEADRVVQRVPDIGLFWSPSNLPSGFDFDLDTRVNIGRPVASLTGATEGQVD